MRIGMAIDLHATAADARSVSWEAVSAQAARAEELGFDVVVLPDHLYYPGPEPVGAWESVAVAGALVAATETIDVGHSMFNSPYRSPALVAKTAETLDELSGGRYILGLGAGNTTDYEEFGFPADERYSRFEEAIRIVHGLLKDGQVDVDGDHWSARGAQMVLRGPREQGPPIVVAARGPRMMRLAARYADEWNGFADAGPTLAAFRSQIEELERACAEVGRDPSTLPRTLDIQVDPLGRWEPEPDVDGPITGSTDEIADAIAAFSELAVTEVRCYAIRTEDLDDRLEAIDRLAEVAGRLHAG